MSSTIINIDAVLRKILVESQELICPDDLIERSVNIDLDFAFGPIRKVYTVHGLRRVGKTYLLHQLRKMVIGLGIEASRTYYINMEDERIPRKTRVLTRLIPLIREEFGVKDTLFLFIDEIHKIPKWSAWARRINDSKKATLFISGSTSKLSAEDIPRELRGRSYPLRLYPLTFVEFLRFRGVKLDLRYIDFSDERLSELLHYLREYIEFGGMPEIVRVEGKHRKMVLAHEYLKTIINRDICDQFDIDNKPALEDLIKLLINSKEFSISKAYNVLKSIGHRVGKETVGKYVGYAEKVFFVEQVTILSRTIKDQLMYPRKIYVADNIFITSIALNYDFGRLLENMVYMELRRRTYSDPAISIHYWKSRNKGEVDFVVIKGLKPIALIQVAWSLEDENVKKREVNSLIKACREFGLNRGVIITYREEGKIRVNGRIIEIIPAWKWLLGLTGPTLGKPTEKQRTDRQTQR